MTNRMQLGAANVKIFKQVIPMLVHNNPDAVLVIISNPVDVLTYLATQLAGLPSSRIMGIGTLVDSARFRAMLSTEERIHPDDLRTYILGSMGQTSFRFSVMHLPAASASRITRNTEEFFRK